MPRKGPAPKRPLVVDPVYQSPLVTQLVNKILLDGKKTVALNDPTLLTNASVDDGDNARQALTSLGERRRMVWISTWNGATGEQTGLDWPAWKTPNLGM